MESDTEPEDSTAMLKTWDKMKNSVHKIGFVEGLSSGKEIAFQSGFDKGYAEGFDSGYTLGKLNGVLRGLQESCRNEEAVLDMLKDTDLQSNSKRGLCLLCNPQNMESYLEETSLKESCTNDSLKNNIKCQRLLVQQAVDRHLEKMKDIYGHFNITTPDTPTL